MSFSAPKNTIIPNDVVALIMDEISYRKDVYNECSNFFRFFDPTIGKLFEVLEAEEEELGQEVIASIYVSPDSSQLTIKYPYGSEDLQDADAETDEQQFFPLEKSMAKNLLLVALQMQCDTYDFYKWLCMNKKNHIFLNILYEHLSLYVESHRKILEEIVSRFHIQAPHHNRIQGTKPVFFN